MGIGYKGSNKFTYSPKCFKAKLTVKIFLIFQMGTYFFLVILIEICIPKTTVLCCITSTILLKKSAQVVI
jgi:hypothetical protein